MVRWGFDVYGSGRAYDVVWRRFQFSIDSLSGRARLSAPLLLICRRRLALRCAPVGLLQRMNGSD